MKILESLLWLQVSHLRPHSGPNEWGGELEGGCGQLLPRSQPGTLSTGGGGDEVGSHQVYSIEKVCAGVGVG